MVVRGHRRVARVGNDGVQPLVELRGDVVRRGFDRIIGAYDDASGVTDAFIRNSLHVINRELDADFDVGNFEYVPLWDSREHRVDMRLRACEPESAHIGALDLDVVFEPGEELRVETSTKFRPADLADELAEAGFTDREFLTDTNDDFALVLARRA